MERGCVSGGGRSHHHDVLRQDLVRAAGAVGELRLHRGLHHLELGLGEPLPTHDLAWVAEAVAASGGRGDASRRGRRMMRQAAVVGGWVGGWVEVRAACCTVSASGSGHRSFHHAKLAS